MATEGAIDLAGTDPGAQRPRRRARVWVAVGLVLSLGALGAARWGDRQVAGREYAQLARCVSDGQGAVTYADARLRTMIAYVAPALSATSAPEVRASMYGLVSQSVAEARPAVDAAVQTCRSVSVVGLHHAIRSARDSYVAYLSARAGFYAAVAADARAARATPADHASLYDMARRQVLSAAPDRSARVRMQQQLG